MRRGIILAAALTVLGATSAQAEHWCGYTIHDNAMIECGYSTVAQCENATGKGGTCFVDPDYARNSRQASPANVTKRPAHAG
jgi:hypothetical protein